MTLIPIAQCVSLYGISSYNRQLEIAAKIHKMSNLDNIQAHTIANMTCVCAVCGRCMIIPPYTAVYSRIGERDEREKDMEICNCNYNIGPVMEWIYRP